MTVESALPDDRELAALSGQIAQEVRDALLTLRREGNAGESLREPADLKSTHDIDRHAAAIARARFEGLHCNLVIEGESTARDENAGFCIHVDPVDGSLNWDRGFGDPAFVLSVARGARAGCLDDLVFTYVEGLRSGDIYLTAGGAAFHRCGLSGVETRLQTAAPSRLADATAYLRAGYGGARRQLARTLPVYIDARDQRASDNAAIEFGDIARNAAHLMVEARGISDGFNLLAWPLVRAAGGVLRGLDGSDLPRAPFDPDAPVDYVLAGNAELADEVLACMDRFEREGRAELEQLMARRPA